MKAAKAPGTWRVIITLIVTGLFVCGTLIIGGVFRPCGAANTARLIFIRNGNVHAYNPYNGSIMRLTNDGRVTAVAVRGKTGQIAYAIFKPTDEGGHAIVTMNRDGTGRKLIKSWEGDQEEIITLAWSPTQNVMYFSYYPHEVIFGGIVRLDMNTKEMKGIIGLQKIGDHFEGYICPAVSPDGKKLVCKHVVWASSSVDPNLNTVSTYGCVMNLDASRRWDLVDTKLTYSELCDTLSPPSWSPDNKWLTGIGKGGQVWRIRVTGKDEKKLTDISGLCSNADWSPDGGMVTFNTVTPGDYHGVGTLYRVRPGGGAVRRLTGGNKDKQGRWIN